MFEGGLPTAAEFSRNVLRGGFPERYSLQVVISIIHYHENMLMSSGGLWQRPHEIHTHPLQQDPNNRQRDEEDWSQLVRGRTLALSTPLAKVFFTSATISGQWS